MDQFRAQEIIGRRIQSIPGRPPIVYVNQHASALPRFVIQYSSPVQQPMTLDGLIRITTEVVVNVEIQEGSGEQELVRLLRLISSAFPVPSQDPEGLQFITPPEVRAPVKGDGFLSVPVFIQGVHYHMSGD